MLVVHYFFVSFLNVKTIFQTSSLDSLFDLGQLDFGNAFSLLNVFKWVNVQWFLITLFLIGISTMLIYFRLNTVGSDQIAFGQKGDSRFTTVNELKKQYKTIDRNAKNYPGIDTFDGVGGIPVSHYKKKYFIDTDTVNSLILGISRSGKGETTITPFIDILSRATIQSSMVVNDPKGELYASSKETLEARGYDVQVLNIQDPMQSMSYNPLQLVIDAWLEGNPEEAGKRANSIAYTLYNNPEAGDNAFFDEGAQSAVVGMILALVEHCVDNDMIEKITFNNVLSMLNTLGQWNYTDKNQEKNALDEYFTNLPGNHVAKQRFGTTKFAGDRTKGSIFATTSNGLQPFVDPSFAKMTSRNSLSLKQIGYPKNLYGQLHEKFLNERIDIAFIREADKSTIKAYKVKVKAQGRFSLNFDEFDGKEVNEEEGIRTGDYLLVKYDNKTLIYQLTFKEKTDEAGHVVMNKSVKHEGQPEYESKVELNEIKNTFDSEDIITPVRLNYSNKPTALFMIVPDFDSSNHALASIFVKQLYTELASNASETKGNKTFKRVHFILDEAGNMPPIDDLDQVLTVCAGRNILFNLVVQSFNQIDSKYGSKASTIRENCQNLIYILSKNEDTIEEVSKQAGSITDLSVSQNNKEAGKLGDSVNYSAEELRLITPTRLRQFIEGEQLVIRSLHRQDLERKKVRPFPILNSGETRMPYRWQFLSQWIDTSKDLNEIDIASEHENLNLNDLAIDFTPFFVNENQKLKYEKQNYPDRYQKKSPSNKFASSSARKKEEEENTDDDIPINKDVDSKKETVLDNQKGNRLHLTKLIKEANSLINKTPNLGSKRAVDSVLATLDKIQEEGRGQLTKPQLEVFDREDGKQKEIHEILTEINKLTD